MKWLIKKISDFTPEEYSRCLSLMTKERQEYINTVTNQKGRYSSVCAEWCIKELTKDITKKSIEEITIIRDKKGKPYLKDIPFYISISHSDDLVAVAISKNQIGIDIEKLKDRDLKICRKVCTQKEILLMENSSNPTKEFYKIWTAKEAYFKKVGTGITNLKDISYENIDCIHFIENEYIITIAK